ncbi:MAG: aspartate--tRNA ligase [Gemmatimonadetes bacterium]|nr:aspartate--tRNA ligase [Gemmatimonadota bacterium]
MDATRTHTCGELRAEMDGTETLLMGWVHRMRDQGGIVFLDLRDRFGMTQVVVEPNGPVSLEKAREFKREYVAAVRGRVRRRPANMVNENLGTGAIEVVAEEITLLNKCKTPPFVIEDETDASEEVRLQYRFLDLRRHRMQETIELRHRASQAGRKYLSEHGFLEIETPLLVRNSPEGARDFLVPSRLWPGKFYSLPQSPQIYKQMLMISGCDRYFQFAKCLRDEALRADRQPEFTQIDIEMSFTTESQVFEIMEGLMTTILKDGAGIEVKHPFPVLSYHDAMERYGSDKPDTRFEMELIDVGEMAAASEFRAFKTVLEGGGTVRALVVPGGATFSRKEIDNLEAHAKTHGAAGLAWCKVKGGELEGGVGRFFDAAAVIEATGAGDGDLVTMVAGPYRSALNSLGAVRLLLGNKLDLIDKDAWNFLWVNRFPLFDWDEEENRWEPAHHMFTMPYADEIEYLETDPGKVHGQLYDMVLNGWEIASGSIRCHDPEIQRRIMAVVGIKGKDADERFGFMLNALAYGAPPHGGIAFGWDRVITLLSGFDSIRDVIPFPKTTSGISLMDGSPSVIDHELLDDLQLAVSKKKKD